MSQHDPHHGHAAAAEKPSAELTWYEKLYVPEILRGLAVTTRHFLDNMWKDRDPNPEILYRKGSKVTTVFYPEEKVEYPPGYRGLHRLVPREDGKPRCVACYMCATVCPAQCIYIEAGEDPQNPVEKIPKQFIIDQLRCVVCGLCVEACPKDAIRMDTYAHTPPQYTREEFLYPIEKLLKGPSVSYPSDPWSKREQSAQPHQHVPLHGVAKHSTEPVPAPKPEPQGAAHPSPPQFTRKELGVE